MIVLRHNLPRLMWETQDSFTVFFYLWKANENITTTGHFITDTN